MEAAEGKQYDDKTLSIDEVRTAGGHPRTGIDLLDKHLEGLETWQIEEVLTITQLKPGLCVTAAEALNPRNLRERKINWISTISFFWVFVFFTTCLGSLISITLEAKFSSTLFSLVCSFELMILCSLFFCFRLAEVGTEELIVLSFPHSSFLLSFS